MAKDMKIFQGQHQGQLSRLPLRTKICTAVTETEYAYLIKHHAKESICFGFAVFSVENYSKNKVLFEPHGSYGGADFRSIALNTSLHCEATDSGLSTFRYIACLITTSLPTDGWPG